MPFNLDNMAVIRLCFEHRATVTDKDPFSGETILHKLANSKSLWFNGKELELLLEHGANPRIRDKEGKLPRDVACAREVDSWERDSKMTAIYILVQRRIGDASLSFKK